MEWNSVISTTITVLHIIAALVLIMVVLLQSGKTAGLSGSIAGGAETFFGKNKGRTIDAKLEKWTKFFAILFFVTCIVLGLVVNAISAPTDELGGTDGFTTEDGEGMTEEDLMKMLQDQGLDVDITQEDFNPAPNDGGQTGDGETPVETPAQ